MFCSGCGFRITNEKANFCKRCGRRLVKLSKRPAFVSSTQPNDIFLKARNKILNFTEPKIEKTRKLTASKLESLQKTIQGQSMYKKLSEDQRTFLAQKLSALRNAVALKDQINEDFSVEEAQEIVDISDELFDQIKEDKCLICYKPLQQDPTDSSPIVVCPNCGHGGHKNHIYSWFEKNSSCPYCKANVKIGQVLIVNL
jgi:rRNA maturation endonuclease Nob1